MPTLYQFAADYYSDYAGAVAVSAASTLLSILLIPLIISLAIAILMTISLWKIFKKAGKGGWESIIPVYNVIVLLQIVDLPLWYIALMIVPFANIYALIKMDIELAKKFGQEGGFAALLILVPVVGFPMLAFGKNKVYMGGGYNTNTQPQQNYQQASYQQPMQTQSQSFTAQPMSATQQPSPQMQPQQLQQQPKAPMDPAKKKKIIMWCCIGGGVLVLGIVAAIVLPIVLRVDYSTAYNTAKELKPEIYDMYNSYDCNHVIDYLKSSSTSTKTYNGYIEGCKEIFNGDIKELVEKLGATDGVKRNKEIKAKFDSFNVAFTAINIDPDDLANKLAIYSDWHSFITQDSYYYNEVSDAEIKTQANSLINSTNEALKAYGEGWIERQMAYAKLYRAWYNSSYPDRENLRKDRDNKYAELKDWLAANKPDVTVLAPLKFDNTNKVYDEFGKLYELIKKTYEKNYNYDSGDCTEFLGEVVCE